MYPDIQGVDTTDPLDISPVNIPEHDVSPSLEERIATIEDILHI